MKRDIEKEAAELLLDAGVSMPLLKIPIIGTVRITMRRPHLGGIVRILREVKTLGVTSQQIETMDIEQKRLFLYNHANTLSRIIALTICRGFVSGKLLAPLLAKIIHWCMPYEYIWNAQLVFASYLGEVQDFLPIINLSERVNPLKPMLSQEKGKRS